MKKTLTLALVATGISLMASGQNATTAKKAADNASATGEPAAQAASAQPALKAGEKFYVGEAHFDNAKGFEVSFVLSADKSEIHDLKIVITDLRLEAHHMKVSTKMTYSSSFPVREHKADVSLGESGNLSIVFDKADVSGSVKYIYVIHNYSSSNPWDNPDIRVDVGTSKILFQAQPS